MAIFVVALLMGSAAATPIATGGSKVTYAAPYSGTVSIIKLHSSSGCDNSQKYTVAPAFNLTTGVANLSQRSGVGSCGNANTTSDVEAFVGVQSNPITGIGGRQHMKLNVALDFYVSLVATPGNSTNFAYSQFYVVALFSVVDRTNGSVPGSNTSQIVMAITNGTYSHTYSDLHLSVYLNATLVSTHSYAYLVEIGGITNTRCAPGINGLTGASATLNMGSKGRHGLIEYVTI